MLKTSRKRLSQSSAMKATEKQTEQSEKSIALSELSEYEGCKITLRYEKRAVLPHQDPIKERTVTVDPDHSDKLHSTKADGDGVEYMLYPDGEVFARRKGSSLKRVKIGDVIGISR